MATALLFTGIHLPLSLYGADGVGDVAYNVSVMVASGIGMRLLIGAFDTWGHRSILALGHHPRHLQRLLGARRLRLRLDPLRRHADPGPAGVGAVAHDHPHGTRGCPRPSWPHMPAPPDGNGHPMSVEVLRYAAFTESGRGGNPAGVVLDAGSLTDPQMLAIAQAIGYSETSFLSPAPARPTRTRRCRRRCGSSARSPRSRSAAMPRSRPPSRSRNAPAPAYLRLHTQAGLVTVESRFEGGQPGRHPHLASDLDTSPRPRPARRDVDCPALDPRRPRPAVPGARGLRRQPAPDARGTHARDAGRSRLRLSGPGAADGRQGWTTTHLFWSENATTFHARNPFPPGGVVEDPATGAAAAAFGGYLRDLGLVPLPSRVVVRQGHDLGAPSELLVDLAAPTTTVRRHRSRHAPGALALRRRCCTTSLRSA